MSVATMKSVAYATDESASDDNTARPVTRDSRSWCARCDGIGCPRSSRLSVGKEDVSATQTTVRAPAPDETRMLSYRVFRHASGASLHHLGSRTGRRLPVLRAG